MKIAVICPSPSTFMRDEKLKAMRSVASPGTEIELFHLEKATVWLPAHLTSLYGEIGRIAIQAEKDGYDGVLFDGT